MPEIVIPDTAVPEDHGLDQSSLTAVRLVAVAVTALLVSFLVINQSSRALTAEASTPPAELRAATVSLTDDDADRTMFDMTDMVPGRPLRNCIAIEYTGSAFGGTVDLSGRGAGGLTRHVDLRVERGTGATFGDCTGFVPERTIFDGSIAEFLQRHGPDEAGLAALDVDSSKVTGSFRFTMVLRDEAAAAGRSASLELLWDVTAS